MPLDVYTVRLTNLAGNDQTILTCIEYITPIHSPKLNGPFVRQNTLRVGSQSVGDKRELKDEKKPVVVTDKTGNLNITSDVYFPVGDQIAVIETKGGDLEITAYADALTNVQQNRSFILYVDGKQVQQFGQAFQTGGWQTTHSRRFVIPVSAGTHLIQAFAGTSAGATLTVQNRGLVVRELPFKED